MSSISSLLLEVFLIISLFPEIPTQLWSSSNYFLTVLSTVLALNLIKISSPISLKTPFIALVITSYFLLDCRPAEIFVHTTGSLWEGWETAGAALL